MTTQNQPLQLPRSSPAAGAHHHLRLPIGAGPVVGQPVTPVDWFRRMPNGGTVFVRPHVGATND